MAAECLHASCIALCAAPALPRQSANVSAQHAQRDPGTAQRILRPPQQLQCRLLASRCRPARRCGCMSTSASSVEQQTLRADTQEEAYDRLADRVLDLANPASRYMVAIAGVPGSGKSTAAAEVSRRLNERREGTAQPDGCQLPCAIAVPMDGFHYYRRELDAMPDAESLHARRGAHWTFNAHEFLAAMHRVRTRNEVLLPSFQHGVGDPVEDSIVVATHHTLVLVEGNYLLIDEPPWHELADLFDDTWYIDCDVDAAMERVYDRQVGDGRLPDVVRGRIAGNDRPNADFIAAVSRHRAAVLVPSLPFAHSK